MKLSATAANCEGLLRLKNTGFDACDFQLGWYFGPNGPFKDVINTDPADVVEYFSKIKEYADKIGMEIFQTHGDFSGQVYSYPQGSREYVAHARLNFYATKALGAKYCVEHPYINLERRYDVNLEQSIDEAIAVYREYIPALEETGVICCLENMHHADKVHSHRCPTTLSRAKEMADMCDVLGKNFAICLDVGHCTVTEDDPIQALEIIGDRLVCLHTHDNDGMWDLHQFPYVPQGVAASHHPLTIDWDAFMTNLAKIGYKGTLNFETGAPCPAPIRDSAYKYLAAIGRYLVSVFEKNL